ncbi:amino acid adenylation domain-containing protein [Pseudomonas sp. RIT-PI-S]|uniref:amino acid adenylation domain-containing protein n=1 Tax=Pseudomonas sp. RIT-PI-S TaxID=3035295 RepID=UPI0021D8BB4D|nr:amino acid adenylation domain-containing protein [Pseudomonas sp. RIT-PI-S]
MKQLTIWLLGRSALLEAVSQELQAYGHECHLQREAALCLPAPRVDLLLEDGSLPLDPALRRDLADSPQLWLAVTLGEQDEHGLPKVALKVRHQDQAVLSSPVAAEHAGNGRWLHQEAIHQWVEALADLVGQLARDNAALVELHTPWQPSPHLLTPLAFDAVAYRHRYNQTSRPALLEIAEHPLGLRLEASFAQHADLTALRWNGQAWTYAQLREAAEPVRQRILADGSHQPVVGVCMDKGLELFACVIGIVLAGAVYLPLEPSHPAQRRRFILENSGARLLFQRNDDVTLEGPWQALDPTRLTVAPQCPPSPDWQAEAPCMALYTSGTTGQPKGVLLSQRNLSHFTAWYAEHTGLGPDSRVLQFSTLSFDSATIDLFPTWLSGATLIVANEDERRDPALLAALVVREEVSHGFLPPALLSILPLDSLAGVDCIATGGDVCEPWVIERLARQCRFLNLYGPTEATVLVTARDFQPHSSNRSLGSPIANSQVWLIGEDGRPVLPGETGELYIIGPGVGLGYIGNPEQTLRRYVELALPDGDTVRAYRTGDLGRWGNEGLELVGRKDNQVKIRGFRVELEEIECCLRDARLYGQVAVVIGEGRRILAFVAHPTGCAEALPDALRQYVAQHLPAYMHPSAYVELPTLPAAPNGKVDRQALLAMPVSAPPADGNTPLTEQQSQLQALWGELLELAPEEISTDESFFNLGGHSIVLSKMLLSLRERFGRSVSINRFIELPTIERLEQLLAADTGNSNGIIDTQALIDANRPIDITPLPLAEVGDVHKVLVTGANSFVGVHIVAALLGWGASEVTCLVRPGKTITAEDRFAAALVDNHLSIDMTRVKVLPADLTQPRLGLSEADYERIDQTYGAVIHNAANVNHVLDYSSLAAENVEPLFELLRLCEGRRKKILNFVSTLSACSAVDSSGAVLEGGPAATPPIYIRNGYNLSKWVGERILQRAAEAGCFVNIFRPGNISFNSVTGVCQPHKNRLMLMLKGSLQLGALPALDLNFDLMPVDFLAKLIAFQASRHSTTATAFNLHNPQPLSWADYVASFAAVGRSFDVIPVPAWQERLKDVDKNNALFGVLGFYLNGFEEDIGDISQIHHVNAAAVVARMGETYPAKDPALLARGSAYLNTIGFI